MSSLIKAIAAALQRLTITAIKSPIDFINGLLGLGGPRMPDTHPKFVPPGDTSALTAELTNGHRATAAAPSRESQAVTAVYKLRNAEDRAHVNLEAVDRREVQDLLIGMSRGQIENLCRAGRPAILKLLQTGNSGVYGVPMTDVARLKAIREEMAKPKPSRPFAMPAM